MVKRVREISDVELRAALEDKLTDSARGSGRVIQIRGRSGLMGDYVNVEVDTPLSAECLCRSEVTIKGRTLQIEMARVLLPGFSSSVLYLEGVMGIADDVIRSSLEDRVGRANGHVVKIFNRQHQGGNFVFVEMDSVFSAEALCMKEITIKQSKIRVEMSRKHSKICREGSGGS